MTDGTLTPAEAQQALLVQLLESLAQKKAKLYEVVRLGAIPLWLDAATVRVLRAADDDMEDRILERLLEFSFVREVGGRLIYEEATRQHLLADWQETDAHAFRDYNRRLAVHFRTRLSDARVGPAQAEPLSQAELYHTAVVDPDAGLALLSKTFRAAVESHRPAAAEQTVHMAETLLPFLPPDTGSYLDYLRGRVDQLHERWELSRGRFQRLLEQPNLSSQVRAKTERALGNTLVQEQQWLEGIAHLQTALARFQTTNDSAEIARTMADLGAADLDFALQSWGGSLPFRLEAPSRWRLPWSVLGIFGRLPLLIYLGLTLGWRALLGEFPPHLHHVGVGMDWVIVRLVTRHALVSAGRSAVARKRL